jgi:hypothetical protein
MLLLWWKVADLLNQMKMHLFVVVGQLYLLLVLMLMKKKTQ